MTQLACINNSALLAASSGTVFRWPATFRGFSTRFEIFSGDETLQQSGN